MTPSTEALQSLRAFLEKELAERMRWLAIYQDIAVRSELAHDQRALVAQAEAWIAALDGCDGKIDAAYVLGYEQCQREWFACLNESVYTTGAVILEADIKLRTQAVEKVRRTRK